MINIYIRNIFRFIVLIFLQIFVFDNIRLGGYMTPYIYILFIILLPFNVSGWALLTSAFCLGFVMDVFYNTMGIHSSACVLAAFLRPVALKLFSPRDGYETGTFPRVYYYGLTWFLKYSTGLILIHHFVLFFIEAFRFAELHHILIRVILSTLLTSLIIAISQFFIYRR